MIEETWNKQDNKVAEIGFSAVPHKKSISLVSKILSRLRLERTTVYIAAPILMFYTIWNEKYLMLLLVGLYVTGLFLYYRYIIGKIESVSIQTSVLKYLRHVSYTLRWFRIHYVVMGLISFILGFALTNDLFQFNEMISLNPLWIALIVCAMIATPLFTFYVHFNPHLNKINKIVIELESNTA